MADDKDQLVDEGLMEKMSVAPPDPEEGDGQHAPFSSRQESEESAVDAPPPGTSGVADEDPLSAHPS
jgi:hypothetical protein